MSIEFHRVKNGSKIRVYVVEVDYSKPKVYREGLEYRFNNKYLGWYESDDEDLYKENIEMLHYLETLNPSEKVKHIINMLKKQLYNDH